jgi:xylulokinase
MKMTGEVTTTASGLSEGVLWDYPSNSIAQSLLSHYQIDQQLLPDLVPTFAVQGKLSAKAASELGIPAHIPIAYRAGDQPNNAFSLNVLKPGEVAATAGTSGVVYGITDRANYDVRSRVNTFLHVNHEVENPRYGVLLCVNGTGILNSWFKNNMTGISRMDYNQINDIVAKAPIGAEGLVILPFGNGAERILENKDIQSQIHGLNFNRHNQAHMFRAMQEGIVFALKYGFDIMQNMGLEINTVKAGHANMFLSPIFREAFCNITGASVALYNTDGAQGAARGAGLGAGLYGSSQEAFTGLQSLLTVEPDTNKQDQYQAAYARWLSVLKNYV